MNHTICKKQTLFPVLGMVIIYALQFLVFPICFPRFSAGSNEASFLFIVPLIAFLVLTNILIDVNIVRWAIADLIYCVLVVVYNGQGLYGIGKRGINLDGNVPKYSFEAAVMSSVVIALAVFVLQTLILLAKKVYLRMKK
ncbi:MAG: hypothetical protein J6V36_01615 [Clostridia bacterium]|nr:hypothetical protein [Clostridia bacterium]